MNKEEKILVLGARGLVGSAIVRELTRQGYTDILDPSREELNLLIQADVQTYMEKHKPEYVIDAAAKVGGIQANNEYRADFISDNLTMQNNIFRASFDIGVKKLLFLGSSCIYPRDAEQPIKEEYLLTGLLEQTNEPYAIAKIAGLKMAESYKKQYGKDFFSVMPTNLYGPGDNFHPEHSHVIPGMIQRMQKAIDSNEDEFVVWGTGEPRREFLYVDDMAEACVFLMNHDGDLPDFVNLGTGKEITIRELAETLADVMGYQGRLVFDTSKPDGTPRKLLDVSRLAELGWKAKTPLKAGLEKTVAYFRESEEIRRV
jgi:GDP-L-fucose synthase